MLTAVRDGEAAYSVIPAQAGIQSAAASQALNWAPARAVMTRGRQAQISGAMASA